MLWTQNPHVFWLMSFPWTGILDLCVSSWDGLQCGRGDGIGFFHPLEQIHNSKFNAYAVSWNLLSQFNSDLSQFLLVLYCLDWMSVAYSSVFETIGNSGFRWSMDKISPGREINHVHHGMQIDS